MSHPSDAYNQMKEFYVGELSDNQQDCDRQASLKQIVLGTFLAFGVYIISSASKK